MKMWVHPFLVLVMERPNGEISLKRSKRLFDLNELDIVAPQDGGIAVGRIAAQQISPSRRRAFLSSLQFQLLKP